MDPDQYYFVGYGDDGGHNSRTPIEPYIVGGPPSYTSFQQLQPLHPLITMTPWPSMLTSSPASYSAPLLPTAPLVTPISASTASATVTPITTTGGSTPRRTLTDDDRRRMCEYHESHPGVKQTEMGAMFGVERSTVSKVLRQKEIFLYSNNGSQGPAKRVKGKFPDIERALVNWARNEQRKGEPLTDAKIKEQAHRFAATVGNTDSQSKLTNSAWLEKFKQKHHLLGNKPRKSYPHSHKGDRVTVVDSRTISLSETPLIRSPLSSGSEGMTSTPTSPYRDYHNSYVSYEGDDTEALFELGQRQDSRYGSMAPIPETMTNPTSPGLAGNRLRLPSRSSNFSRPRSQSSPNFGFEPATLMKSEKMEDMLTPTSEGALEESPIAIDPRKTMKRNKSVPEIHSLRSESMQPPPVPRIPRSANTSPILASSPTQDEAKKALDLVWTFFTKRPGSILDPEEMKTIGKLMAKLNMAQSLDNNNPLLAGGIHPLEASTSPAMTKKRTVEGIHRNKRPRV